jgi:hypothetical protein
MASFASLIVTCSYHVSVRPNHPDERDTYLIQFMLL